MRIELAGGITHPDPLIIVYTGPDTFDTLDFIGRGYTNFDVTCIGGGGGMGLGYDSGPDEGTTLKAYGGRGGGGGYHRVRGLLSALSADSPVVVGSGGADGFEPDEDDPENIATMYAASYVIDYWGEEFQGPEPTSRLYRVVAKENWQNDLESDGNLDMELVGDIGFGVRCMDVDPTSGILYAITHPMSAESPNCLITIDKDTGAGTLVGSLGVGSGLEENKSPLDITFLPNGTLVALSSESTIIPYPLLPDDPSDDSHIRTVNKETGAVSAILGDALFTGGESANGYGIFYNPTDNSIYVFFADRLWRVVASGLTQFDMADDVHCDVLGGAITAAMDVDNNLYIIDYASYSNVYQVLVYQLDQYSINNLSSALMMQFNEIGEDPIFFSALCFDPNIAAVIDPTFGQPGGYSSFNDTVCRASGGRGGVNYNPEDGVFDQSDANGGDGGIGDSIDAGGGALGGEARWSSPDGPISDGSPGGNGSLIADVGQGGGGGAGGVGIYHTYYGSEVDHIGAPATAGGSGSSGDSSVASSGTPPTNDPTLTPGIITVPGLAGGAKAVWAGQYGRSGQDGVVVIRLTAE